MLIATGISLLSTIKMFTTGSPKNLSNMMALIIEISSMLLSWFLVHTTFAIRYAHIYYGDSEEDADTHAGGLEFPKEKKPDFIDFAYYSFTLGMTFQVSDVEIGSRKMRRLSLLHALFSFAYNAAIIAFTVNIISDIIKR